MEIVLAEHLFPASLSMKERTAHWVAFFSLFTQLHIRALNSILSQKQRYTLFALFKLNNAVLVWSFLIKNNLFFQAANGNASVSGS